MMVNSGSSANLVAVSTLTSPLLGDRRLLPGDEVITVAAGFPTTVAPIVQNRLIPVFVDVDLGGYNALPDRVAEAIGPRTRAVILAHTLGNPWEREVHRAATQNPLIEDWSTTVRKLTESSRPGDVFVLIRDDITTR